jgi:3-phosphoshikimate 1-carboxyvinyltransferase
MPVASAQVKSALLFAGLFAAGETRVAEPVSTRDHGELALRAFGATVKQRANESRIEGGQKLQAIETEIPGDLSSASFFLCAAALFPGSHLMINDLLMNPTRTRLLDLLISMGAGISVTQIQEQQGELRGSLQIEGRSLTGAVVSGAESAALIDEIPVLAAIAPHTSSGIEIRDAQELRVKESDRIAGLATNLRAMGAQVEERGDGLKIPGGQKLRGGEVESFGDHRIAMAFAVAALRAEGEIRIRQADAAVISYPEFFTVLENLVQH